MEKAFKLLLSLKTITEEKNRSTPVSEFEKNYTECLKQLLSKEGGTYSQMEKIESLIKDAYLNCKLDSNPIIWSDSIGRGKDSNDSVSTFQNICLLFNLSLIKLNQLLGNAIQLYTNSNFECEKFAKESRIACFYISKLNETLSGLKSPANSADLSLEYCDFVKSVLESLANVFILEYSNNKFPEAFRNDEKIAQSIIFIHSKLDIAIKYAEKKKWFSISKDSKIELKGFLNFLRITSFLSAYHLHLERIGFSLMTSSNNQDTTDAIGYVLGANSVFNILKKSKCLTKLSKPLKEKLTEMKEKYLKATANIIERSPEEYKKGKVPKLQLQPSQNVMLPFINPNEVQSENSKSKSNGIPYYIENKQNGANADVNGFNGCISMMGTLFGDKNVGSINLSNEEIVPFLLGVKTFSKNSRSLKSNIENLNNLWSLSYLNAESKFNSYAKSNESNYSLQPRLEKIEGKFEIAKLADERIQGNFKNLSKYFMFGNLEDVPVNIESVMVNGTAEAKDYYLKYTIQSEIGNLIHEITQAINFYQNLEKCCI